MAASGVDLAELVKDLRRQVTALGADLRARSDEVDEFAAALTGEYEQAYEAQRTAATYGAWRDARVLKLPRPGCWPPCSSGSARTTG